MFLSPPDSDLHVIPSTVDRVDRHWSSCPTPVPSPYVYDTSPVSPNSPFSCTANRLPPSHFANDSDQYGHQNLTLPSPSSPCIIDPHTITRSHIPRQVMPAEASWAYQVVEQPEHEIVGEHLMYDMAVGE